MRVPYEFYFASLAAIHVAYMLAFLGILSAVPKYVYVWNMVVQIGLCMFLMYRYHPFKTQYKFETIDARLIFGSSLLLFVNIISLPLLYSRVVDAIQMDPIQIMRDKVVFEDDNFDIPEIPEIRL